MHAGRLIARYKATDTPAHNPQPVRVPRSIQEIDNGKILGTCANTFVLVKEHDFEFT